jgi:hypothetical protein
VSCARAQKHGARRALIASEDEEGEWHERMRIGASGEDKGGRSRKRTA